MNKLTAVEKSQMDECLRQVRSLISDRDQLSVRFDRMRADRDNLYHENVSLRVELAGLREEAQVLKAILRRCALGDA
jgi:uncharacterized coiled-coil DUF342 family protein